MPESTPRHRRAITRNFPKLSAPLAVLGGGLVGSGARVAVNEVFPVTPTQFPSTTLVVNVVGSLLLGFLIARRQRAIGGRFSLQFWGIGVLGSFTTFSTFSAEVFRLMDGGAGAMALGYLSISLAGGLTAAILGQRLGWVGR